MVLDKGPEQPTNRRCGWLMVRYAHVLCYATLRIKQPTKGWLGTNRRCGWLHATLRSALNNQLKVGWRVQHALVLDKGPEQPTNRRCGWLTTRTTNQPTLRLVK